MIVFYLQKLPRGGTIAFRRTPARKFVGDATFYDESRSRAIKLGNRRVIFRATVFDDATTPPTLIRCDYGFHELREHGAELPPTYIDHCGAIVRTADDVVLMPGPNEEENRKQSSRSFDTEGRELSIPNNGEFV